MAEVLDVLLEHEDGRRELLTATDEHPFAVEREAGPEWVVARELRAGDRVVADEGAATVQSVARRVAPTEVFNLVVESAHAYLVGDGVLVHNGNGYGGAAKGPIWSSTKSKTAAENAFGHWKKHGAEFPEFRNAKEYVEGAQRFVNQPSKGVLSKVRANGDTVLYDPASNTFGVRAADGAPKTMFKPDPAQHGYSTNLDYFNAQ